MSFLTLTDLFCGAGGSSTGAIMVEGVRVVGAGNHWDKAIETHSTNHPDARHICADLSQIDPRLFPHSDIGWFSPSCTKHSVAQGKKRAGKVPDLNGEVLPDAAAERSRATMWDVVRFSEYHDYRAVIVENVVDVYYWPPFQAWLAAMSALGYRHELVWLNSMHAHVFGPGAPQSRDRLYIVFWKEGATRPDLEWINRPLAHCLSCGPVRAVKVWKKPTFQWGRYRAQYTFRCPSTKCRRTIEPHYRPASDIIDWTLKGTRIGDRDRPLADKTMARIQAGMNKYWSPLLVPVEGREGKLAVSIDGPARTMTTRNETGLAVPCGGTWRDHAASLAEPLSTRTTRETDGLALHPFIAELRGGGSKYRPVSDPLCTVTASGNHHGLVMSYYGKGGNRTTADPIATVTSVETHALLMRNNTARGDQGQMSTPVTEPARTITTAGHQSLITGMTIDIYDVLFRMLEPREIIAAMDFPTEYIVLGNRREQVRMAGNAVTPPSARDLVGLVAGSIDPAFMPDIYALAA